ncbi:hypothetical protein FDP41_012618 [Naegleria fowleri]|uniref:Enoyl-CoA hydratase n=1 Tax=Naegleria fowleri TaxID=5763 RepID=A0A6A5C6C9_NAEFO|nr:uncharacterized protein FDP41_012618 [Naegleria fowleri]KAF0981358.1 hypothetical protein FDP41_012618 [Naegleria fowleri]
MFRPTPNSLMMKQSSSFPLFLFNTHVVRRAFSSSSRLHAEEKFVLFEEIPLSQIAPNLTTSNTASTTIGLVTINKPDKMNALCPKTAIQFRELFESDQICNNKNLGCLVLTGAKSNTQGKSAFSAGGDFDFLLERCNDQPFNNSARMLQFYNSFLTPLLKLCPIPTISALNGHAIGAGLAIALATDIRFVEANAKLGVNFVNLGLSPGMASTYFLPYLLGHQSASALLLTGDLISAQKALELGMVYEVIEGEDQLRERALEYAARIARNPPIATKLCLKNLRMQQLEGLEKMIIREADAQAQSYADPILKQTIESLIRKSNEKK